MGIRNNAGIRLVAEILGVLMMMVIFCVEF